MMENMFRKNFATAQSTDFKLHGKRSNGDHTWEVGVDGIFAEHDSTITNPNNMMFKVENFNNVEDTRISAFAQWQGQYGDNTYSVGARIKHNQADAGEVSHHMAGANMMIGKLVSNINDADRSVSDTNFDLALNMQSVYNENMTLYAGVGVKQRAPSYQERYLWMPMEATGGLADGKTYIGNINLDSETAYQLDVGLNYHNGDLYIAPHIYYQNIDNYIQGTATSSQAAKMVASMMMGDESPLQFSNVDAKIYGADIRWQYLASNSWKLSGQAAYVRGQRRDVDDPLYRIAPANASVAVTYLADAWQVELEIKGFAEQDNVSDTNYEMETAGYGVLNLAMDYDFNDDLTFRAGIDNLLDRQYRSHLSGYYRVNNGEIAKMSRVPGEGVNYYVEVDYRF
jgi:iron complex outermembrane receptor protein